MTERDSSQDGRGTAPCNSEDQIKSGREGRGSPMKKKDDEVQSDLRHMAVAVKGND